MHSEGAVPEGPRRRRLVVEYGPNNVKRTLEPVEVSEAWLLKAIAAPERIRDAVPSSSNQDFNPIVVKRDLVTVRTRSGPNQDYQAVAVSRDPEPVRAPPMRGIHDLSQADAAWVDQSIAEDRSHGCLRTRPWNRRKVYADCLNGRPPRQATRERPSRMSDEHVMELHPRECVSTDTEEWETAEGCQSAREETMLALTASSLPSFGQSASVILPEMSEGALS